MGSVYEVKDLNVAGKIRAAKEILDSALQGPHCDYVKSKFQAEMRSLATLSHPGIPQVIDFFQVGQASYIIMDYVIGLNLEDELRQRMCELGQPSPPEQVVADALEVMDILAYLHSQDPPVLHRDIKPANLIRNSKTKKVILVDFGLARSHQEGEVQTRVGTPGYCSQEQMAGKAEPRSDLYSLGVTLYHLLSGKAPRMLTCEPLADVIPGFDPDLSAIIERATQLRVRDRYPDAAKMIEELQRWRKQHQRQVEDTSELNREPVSSASPNLGALLGGAAVVVALAAGIWLGSSRLGLQPSADTKSSSQPTATPELISVSLDPALPPDPIEQSDPKPEQEDYFSNAPLHHHRKVRTQAAAKSSPRRLQPSVRHPELPDSQPVPPPPPPPPYLTGMDEKHRLPITSLVQVPRDGRFKDVSNENHRLELWVRRSKPTQALVIEAFFFREKPADALRLKLGEEDPGGERSTTFDSVTARVTYTRPFIRRSGFVLLRAVPFHGGSIVYSNRFVLYSIDRDTGADEVLTRIRADLPQKPPTRSWR
jgi:serine/threonine protein kinase